MNPLEQLKAKLARRKAINASAIAEGREYTTEEQQELDTLEKDCDKLSAQIEQAKKFDNLEAGMNAGEGRQTSPVAPGPGNAKAKDEKLEAMGGFESVGAYFNAVRRASAGSVDERLISAAATNVVGADGGDTGYSLPPMLRTEIFKLFEEDQGDLMGQVTGENTAARSVQYLKDTTTPWEAAGITVHWDGSSTDMKPTKFNAETAGQCDLHGLSVFVITEEDLMIDAPALQNRVLSMAPEAMRWAVNEAIRTGDGVGKPKGYMTSAALVTVAAESGQSSKTLVAQNIAKMFTRMLPSSIKNAHWEINPELLPELMLLKDEAGNLLFTPLNVGFGSAPSGLLLGRPVVFNEHPEAAGDKGDIQFIDPKGYYLPKRTSAADYAESIHLYFDQALKCFRWRFRVGGQTFLSKPVAPAKGSLTKSHFVTLAARA